jgi:hypothetical protein
MTEENKCKQCSYCEWYINTVCCCDGIKPCNVLTTTQDTDYYLGKIVNSAK